MKKIYNAPCAKIITIDCATLIANSLPVGGGEKIEGEDEILSNRREGFFGGNMWDNM